MSLQDYDAAGVRAHLTDILAGFREELRLVTHTGINAAWALGEKLDYKAALEGIVGSLEAGIVVLDRVQRGEQRPLQPGELNLTHIFAHLPSNDPGCDALARANLQQAHVDMGAPRRRKRG